ncbi:MAG: efflux RND transporter permease subunit [Rikenellaceae bacterium]|jgi:multidrug efflux pump|nr:efflux RND transporter permease subunit [Rikenellaceae bacterium]
MSLASTSINRPVLATVMNIVIVIIGAIGFTFLGVRDYPSVDPPVITVRTTFAGANADVIETQITEVLESYINGIPGIRTISSTSSDGSSYITVEFKLEVPLETAANDVRNKVAEAQRRLPPDVDAPVVTKADANSQPIYGVTLESEKRNIIDLSEFAEVNFKERLQTVVGVSSVDVRGSRRMSIRMKMEPMLLAAYRLTPMDVRDAVTRENVELPSGRIEGSSTELTIRTMGRLRTVEDFNNLIISKDGERIVRFRDVGRTIVDAENTRSILKRNGVTMVSCMLIPQPGANYINIVDEAKKAIEQIKKDLPEDIVIRTGFDNTKFIRQSIGEVGRTIVEAFCLVVLIIFLFLRSWRTTLIPVLAIPISLVGTFFIMYLMGFSINILTLLAVVLSIGLVVDDAIVVMENIYQKVEAGMSPKEAGVKGAEEIFFAVLATTIALVAVFFPIVFLSGVSGRLFREFSLVIAGAVVISAFVALSFTPMLSTKFLSQRTTQGRFYTFTEPFFVWLNNIYRRGLAAFLRRRFIAVAVLAVSMGAIVWLWGAIPSEMAPLEDRSMINVSSTAPEGASYEYMLSYADTVASVVNLAVPEQDGGLLEMVGLRGTPNNAYFNIILQDPDRRARSQMEIADDLTARLGKLTGAKTIVTQQATIGSGGGGGLPIRYVIQAQNLDAMKRILPRFMEEVGQSRAFSVSDVDLRFNKPELTVAIDRDRASLLGVSVQNIAQTLQLAMSEQRIGYYVRNGKQYQIMTMFDRPNRSKPNDLTNIYVRNENGELLQLDNFVTITENSTPPKLYRFNRFVSATVSAGLAKGTSLGQGLAEMDRIARATLDDTFGTELAGDSRDFVESSSSLIFAFALALILIYLVLSAQFESFRDPLTIMLTVPLALLGALATMRMFGQTMNIFSQIGIIMLIGLVSKNGILIVEFANQRKKEGATLREAIEEASLTRLRPILMTSLATILGILPMAYAMGSGAASRVAMGIAVVGGMICATFLTLFIIPAIYTYLSSDNSSEHSGE